MSCRRRDAPRLVVDIGGGSTEFIIGRGLEPDRLESLTLGCVSTTQKILSRRNRQRERIRRRRDRRPGRNRSHRRRFRRGALERRLRLVGYGGGTRRDSRAERLFRRRDHAGRPRPAAQAPGSRPRSGAPEAQCAQARARAGACRRPGDHERGGHRARHRADRPGRRRAAAGRALRPARPNHRPRRRAAYRRAFSRTLPRRPRARRSRRCARDRAVCARRPERRAGATTDAALGRAAARDRHVGLAHRVPQARCLHPAARGHARFFGRRAGAPRLAGLWLSRRPCQGARGAPRSAGTGGDRGAPGRGGVLSRPHRGHAAARGAQDPAAASPSG